MSKLDAVQPADGGSGAEPDRRNVIRPRTKSNGNPQPNRQVSRVRRLPQIARRWAAVGYHRAQQISYLLRPRYRTCPNTTGLSLEYHLSLPLSRFTKGSRLLRHSADFLPDRYSRSGEPFTESPHFHFARSYLRDTGFDHRATSYYQLAVQGHLACPCRGPLEAESRCRRFIALINDLQQFGYDPERFGAICLAKGRDDSLLVLNGKHRLASLLVMDINNFPVAFCPGEEIRARLTPAIQRTWPPAFYRKTFSTLQLLGEPCRQKKPEIVRLQSYIRSAKLQTWADVYHPIPFYEFQGFTTQVDPTAAYRRLAMLLSLYRSFEGLRVLDLGCNVGFYSLSLARRGAHVIGLDTRREFVTIAQTLSEIYDIPVDFREEPATPDWKHEHDLVLCFSMLQWVISQRGEEYGRRLLSSISKRSKALLFDVAVNEGKSCLLCTPGNELVFVRDLLRHSTTYKNVKHLGDVHPYGTDTRHVFYCYH